MQQRLRSKSGCFSCRSRKKKCDEQQPICSDCLRFGRRCAWPAKARPRPIGLPHGRQSKTLLLSLPSPSPSPTSTESPLSETSSLVNQLSLQGGIDAIESKSLSHYWRHHGLYWQPTNYYPVVASLREKMLFHHFATYTMPKAIRTHAHPVFAEYRDVYELGFQIPDIMNLFLGIAALHISQGDTEASLEATRLYNPSVNAVWSRIHSGEINGTEEWLIISIVFMVLFESNRFNISSNIMTHLEGLAQLFRMRKTKFALPDSSKPFHRIAVESFIYHLATSSLLYPNLDRIAEQFSWVDLNGYYQTRPFPHASEIANSPILGSPATLHRTIFGVTRLSRHTPLGSVHFEEALTYKRTLDGLQQRFTQSLDFMNERNTNEAHVGALLYTLASQLFLFKVMHPEVDSDNATIQHLVKQVLLLAASYRFDLACSTYICWPLTVLACAVQDEDEKMLVRSHLAKASDPLSFGHVYRTEKIIEAIWNDGRFSEQVEHGERKPAVRILPLDRLIWKTGLLASLGT